MDLPSRLDLYSLGRQYVLQRAAKIDPGMVDVLGSDANLIIGSSSVLADVVIKQLGYSTARLTLDGSFDEDLDRYAWDRYQLTRNGAAPATGVQRFYRATYNAGAGTIPTGTVLTTLNGVQYVTTQPAVFGATQLNGVLANVAAAQAGQATQVGANNITRFQNPSVLFDATIQTNNDATTGMGSDREQDDDFKRRIRSFWLTARRGTLGAIEFGALTVPGVASAMAIEVVTPGLNGLQPARVVNLYIADGSGVASLPAAQAVGVVLLDYRAAGIAVLVSLSIPYIQNIVLNLAFDTGVDTITLSSQIIAAVVEFVNGLPVNGTLYVAQLFSVLQRFTSLGLVPNQGSIVSPAFDVIPVIGQTIRTTSSSVTLGTVPLVSNPNLAALTFL